MIRLRLCLVSEPVVHAKKLVFLVEVLVFDGLAEHERLGSDTKQSPNRTIQWNKCVIDLY